MRLDDPLDREAAHRRVLEILPDVALRIDDDRAPGARVADEVRRVRQALEVVLLEDERTHTRRLGPRPTRPVRSGQIGAAHSRHWRSGDRPAAARDGREPAQRRDPVVGQGAGAVDTPDLDAGVLVALVAIQLGQGRIDQRAAPAVHERVAHGENGARDSRGPCRRARPEPRSPSSPPRTARATATLRRPARACRRRRERRSPRARAFAVPADAALQRGEDRVVVAGDRRRARAFRTAPA